MRRSHKEHEVSIRTTSVHLTIEQIDDIVLERLKQDYDQLKSIRDRFGSDYENDFFKAIKLMIRYYMIESEYQAWAGVNNER